VAILKHTHGTNGDEQMESIAVRKAEQLEPKLKQGVENLFGRPLREGEAVTFMSFTVHAAPPESVRREAVVRLEKIMDMAAENAKDIPERELDAAIDEAMDHVRPWRE
jgi:hypothetical protein